MVCLLLMRRRSAASPVGWSRQKLPRDRRLGPFYSVAVLCGRSSRVGNSRCYWLSCRTCRRSGENDYRGRVLHSRRKGRFGVVVVFPQMNDAMKMYRKHEVPHLSTIWQYVSDWSLVPFLI